MATLLYTPPESNAADFNFARPVYTPVSADEADFNFAAPFQRHEILAGSSNNFTSIWADSDAGLDNGKFYVASSNDGAALSIINMDNHVLFDAYTKYIKGAADEVLDAEDIEDINIVMRS